MQFEIGLEQGDLFFYITNPFPDLQENLSNLLLHAIHLIHCCPSAAYGQLNLFYHTLRDVGIVVRWRQGTIV